MCAATNRESYTVLPGANDNAGGRYEYLISSYVALKLLLADSKIDFKLSNNSQEFGKFDDVIVEIPFENGTMETWAMQLKHGAAKKPIREAALRAVSGDFSLNMYFKDHQERKRLAKTKFVKSVLFTNRPFQKDIPLKIDGKPYILKPFKSTATFPFDTSEDCSVYQFAVEFEPRQAEHPNEIDDYKDFFQNFYFCDNQKNVDEIDQEVSQVFEKAFGSFGVDKYKKFFETWCTSKAVEGCKEKVYKEDIKTNIAKIVLEPHVVPTNASVSCTRGGTLKTIISKFDVTLIDDNCGNVIEYLSQICGSGVPNYWDNGHIPVVISVNNVNMESVCESINVLSAHHKFILVGERVNSSKFSNCKVFGNLLDLDSDDYMDVTTNFYCVVQGRKLSSLREILKSNPKLRGYFTLRHLLNMMDETIPFVIGDATVELPKNYIKRFLPKHIFSCKLITTLSDGEVLVISCCNENEREKVENLKNCRTLVIDITNRDFVIEREHRGRHEKIIHPVILVSKNKVSISKFDEICSKNNDKESVFNFEFLENSLNLLSMHGTSSKFIKYREKTTHETIPDVKILSNFMSKTNLLVANPGMGKTICADLIKQICPFDAWPIKINLREKLELFKNFTSVQDLLAKVVCTDAQSVIAKHFRDYYYNEKRCLLIWDGMDEIGSENVDSVINILKNVSRDTRHYQWITSRYHLKEKLESFFDIESITLIEAAKNEQRK